MPTSYPVRNFFIAAITALIAPVLLGQSLKVKKIEVKGSTVTLEVNADAGHYYALERLDLPAGIVESIVDLKLGVMGSNLVDSAPPTLSGFYRVRSYDSEYPGDLDKDGIDDVHELNSDNLNPLDPSDAGNPLTLQDMNGNPVSTTELDGYLNGYLIGRGMHDITGPAADEAMMGYADGDQKTKGIHDRQWARAFIVKDRKSPYRSVVHVVVENGQVFQSIYQGVFDKIRNDGELKDHYSYENIVLSATHTHGAAGNHSHFALYHALTGGFSWRTYDALTHGIYMAIKKAHRDLKEGGIKRNRGLLTNANENRRPNAFLANIEHDKPNLLGNPFGSDNRDTEMTLLRFEHKGIGPVAMFNWFPVHGVSVSKLNKLLTGDNKGNAAHHFERDHGAIYPGYSGYDSDTSTFVAGFANSNPGDLTANRRTLEAPWPDPRDGSGAELTAYNGNYGSKQDFDRARLLGGRQLTKANALYGAVNDLAQVSGPIDYRHMYVDMNNVTVVPSQIYPYNVAGVGFPGVTDSSLWKSCRGALGTEFAAGTKDGEGMDLTFLQALGDVFPDPCQAPKSILLTTASTGAGGLTAHWLPISILRVGDFAILAVPGEFTVTAGYRLRKTVELAFAAEGQRVRAVLSGLSNSYAGYVTTYEEYMHEEAGKQGYEAASTHFGRFTLAAYQTKFAEMATDIAKGTGSPASPISVTMPSHARSEEIDPALADKLAVLDIEPFPDTVAATYHEPAGCGSGQFHIVGTEDCWSCPAGYDQTFVVTTAADACEKLAYSTFTSATELNEPGCPAGQFLIVGTGKCWKCPSGYQKALVVTTAATACEKPAYSLFTSANRADATGGSDCPSGYVYDFILGECYKCPSGYGKNVTRAWDASNACEKTTVSTTSANNTAGTGLIGTDCPSGYVYDFGLGRCYKCPSGYGKHVLRAWNAGNACVKNVYSTIAAYDTEGTGGSDCPSGYAYDFTLGYCYKCPTDYNKVILNAWNHSRACEKVVPRTTTAANDQGAGGLFCPSGQFLDVGEGTCWSCPTNYNRNNLVAVSTGTACEKVIPRETIAANKQGKFHCELRDPSWFLDIGLNQCWSCPSGTSRLLNLNPVDGGAACTRPRTFGDIRTDVKTNYKLGETLSVSFWSGHPKNVFGTFDDGTTNGVDTFFEIQKSSGGSWVTVRTDADWDTEFHWTPQGLSGASTVKWKIPSGTARGTYRVHHKGYRSDVIQGVVTYSGNSSEFKIK